MIIKIVAIGILLIVLLFLFAVILRSARLYEKYEKPIYEAEYINGGGR